MGFVFRMERLLSVRRIEEDAAQQRHAQAQRDLRQAAAALDASRACLSQTLCRLDDLKHRDQLTEEALFLHSLRVSGLRREIDQARAHLRAAEQGVERAADELLRAHQAREALERLREREELSWKREQATREVKEMDEIAVMRSRTREEENHGL